MTLYDGEYSSIVTHTKRVLMPMMLEAGLTRSEAEALAARARGVLSKSMAYPWLLVGVKSGAINLAECHQDLITHALLAWDGDPKTTLRAAVKPWTAEQYQYADVRTRTINGMRVVEPRTVQKGGYRGGQWGPGGGELISHEARTYPLWHDSDENAMNRIVDQLAAEADWAVISERLTPRERDVIAALADGDTQHEAADRLGLTRKAIQVALRKVRDKAEGALKAGLLTASVDAP